MLLRAKQRNQQWMRKLAGTARNTGPEKYTTEKATRIQAPLTWRMKLEHTQHVQETPRRPRWRLAGRDKSRLQGIRPEAQADQLRSPCNNCAAKPMQADSPAMPPRKNKQRHLPRPDRRLECGEPVVALTFRFCGLPGGSDAAGTWAASAATFRIS